MYKNRKDTTGSLSCEKHQFDTVDVINWMVRISLAASFSLVDRHNYEVKGCGMEGFPADVKHSSLMKQV